MPTPQAQQAYDLWSARANLTVQQQELIKKNTVQRQAEIAILLVAVICGLLIGLDSAQDHLGGREQFAMLFGSAVGIYLLLLYPMGLAEYLQRRQWQRIGVRVAGSWSAASALLVLTLTFTAPEHETGERATQPPLSVPVAAVAASSAATRQ